MLGSKIQAHRQVPGKKFAGNACTLLLILCDCSSAAIHNHTPSDIWRYAERLLRWHGSPFSSEAMGPHVAIFTASRTCFSLLTAVMRCIPHCLGTMCSGMTCYAAKLLAANKAEWLLSSGNRTFCAIGLACCLLLAHSRHERLCTCCGINSDVL